MTARDVSSARPTSEMSAGTAAIALIRDRVMNTADAAEGMKSFVERRAAVFQGR
ncbi:MAG TPA: hypothetical protein VEC38_11795 [Candidatus Binataceae bacterium]|nr:hypothetical protein [Candidatus Binataceae bacterium]